MQPQDDAARRTAQTPGNGTGGASSSGASSASYSAPPLPEGLAPLDETSPPAPAQSATPVPAQPQAPAATPVARFGTQNEGVVAPAIKPRPVPIPKAEPQPRASTLPRVAQPAAPSPQLTVATGAPQPASRPVVPRPVAQTPAQSLTPNVPVSPLNPAGSGLAQMATPAQPKVEPVLNPAEPIVDAPAPQAQNKSKLYVEPVLAPDPQKSQADAAALALDTTVEESYKPAESPPPVITPDYSPVPPAKVAGSRLKVILIAIGVVVILSGSLYGYLAITKKGNTPKSSTGGNKAKSGPVANVPDGYKLIDRDCFSFPMIDSNLTFNDNTSCYVLATFGDRSQGKFNVFPETRSQDTVAKYAEYKKQQYNTKVISQNELKIDGFDAIKVTENVGSSSTSEIDVRYYVLTSGKDYQYQGIGVNGFEIQAYYNDEASRKAVDTAISNWRWK